jgi:hypothetical protein
MGVNGQHHAPAALYPPGKEPPVPIGQEAGWAPEPAWTHRLEEKSSASVGDRTPVIQSVVSHYTDWATPAPHIGMCMYTYIHTHARTHTYIHFLLYITTHTHAPPAFVRLGHFRLLQLAQISECRDHGNFRLSCSACTRNNAHDIT